MYEFICYTLGTHAVRTLLMEHHRTAVARPAMHPKPSDLNPSKITCVAISTNTGLGLLGGAPSPAVAVGVRVKLLAGSCQLRLLLLDGRRHAGLVRLCTRLLLLCASGAQGLGGIATQGTGRVGEDMFSPSDFIVLSA